MLNRINITLEPIVGSRVSGSGRIIGAETDVNNELVKIEGFTESDGGDLVRRSWVDGSKERMK